MRRFDQADGTDDALNLIFEIHPIRINGPTSFRLMRDINLSELHTLIARHLAASCPAKICRRKFYCSYVSAVYQFVFTT